MKRLLVLFTAVVLSACSNEDSDTGNSLTFGGQPFETTSDPEYVKLRYYSNLNLYRFTVSDADETADNFHRFEIAVTLDADRQSIDGTYDFDTDQVNAFVYQNHTNYNLGFGKVTIKDLGDDKYKISIHNSSAFSESDFTDLIVVKGTFKGQFSRTDM